MRTGSAPHRPADSNEFRHVQAPLPTLIFGDKRLVLAEPFGKFLLGQAGCAKALQELLNKRNADYLES